MTDLTGRIRYIYAGREAIIGVAKRTNEKIRCAAD